MIAPVKGADGAYVATGHNVWGILNAPATGEAMAELILDGAARHVDLAPFTPDRLPTFDPARLRDRASLRRATSGMRASRSLMIMSERTLRSGEQLSELHHQPVVRRFERDLVLAGEQLGAHVGDDGALGPISARCFVRVM